MHRRNSFPILIHYRTHSDFVQNRKAVASRSESSMRALNLRQPIRINARWQQNSRTHLSISIWLWALHIQCELNSTNCSFQRPLTLLQNLMEGKVPHEELDEVNSLALRYSKRMKKQRADPILSKNRRSLNKKKIKVIPFDKRMGFCLMSQET